MRQKLCSEGDQAATNGSEVGIHIEASNVCAVLEHLCILNPAEVYLAASPVASYELREVFRTSPSRFASALLWAKPMANGCAAFMLPQAEAECSVVDPFAIECEGRGNLPRCSSSHWLRRAAKASGSTCMSWLRKVA